jgi:hypothetical protein
MEVNKLDELVRQYFNPDGLPSKAYQLFLEDLASHAIQVQALPPPAVEVGGLVEEMTHPFFEEKRTYNFEHSRLVHTEYLERWYMPRYLLMFFVEGKDVGRADVEIRFNKERSRVTIAKGTTGGLRQIINWKINPKHMTGGNFCRKVEGFPYGTYEYESHTDKSVTFKYKEEGKQALIDA